MLAPAGTAVATDRPVHLLDDLDGADDSTYPTTADSPAFWLYTSGTTGLPEGRDAPARRRRGRVRDLRPAGARHRARRPLPVGGQGVLRLRPRQLGALPAGRRSRRGARTGALDPDDDRRAGTGLRRDPVLRRAHVLRQHAARRPAGRLARRRPHRGQRRRGPAGLAVHAVDRALRRRHPRRHRHDRDAAHLPVEPARPGPARHHRRRRPRLRPAPARRRRPRGRARHARHAVRPRRLDRHRLLVALRRLPPGVPGRVAAHRRHLRPGRRRLLPVPRAHRRHAQGQRHLGLAGRGRGPAAGPRRGGPGRRRRGDRRGRAGEAGGLRRAPRRRRASTRTS